MSQTSIMDSIKNKLLSAQDGELKTIYEDLRSHAGEDAARIEAYIDTRIEMLGDKLRGEFREGMKAYREETKEANKVLFVFSVLAWMLAGAFIVLRFLRVF